MSVTQVLDFVCKNWTGNFEHEFVTYVFAMENWEDRSRDYSQYIPEDEKPALAERLEDLPSGWNGEYGWTYQEPLLAGKDPVNGQDLYAVRVRIDGEAWDNKMTPELIQELKDRAVEFFAVLKEHDSYSEAVLDSFVELRHKTVTTVESDFEAL